MCQQCDELIGELDKVVSAKQRPLEGQWNSDIWRDIILTGSETAGTILVARLSERFNARSIIAWNTSGETIALSGGIIIPRNTSEFVARVTPPRNVFQVSVNANPSGPGGELHIWLTEELLEPTPGYL